MVSPAPRTARTPSRRRSSYLHQQLVPRDPLHGLDHQVGQSLLLLVLPHALLQKQAKKKNQWGQGDKDGPVRWDTRCDTSLGPAATTLWGLGHSF